MDDVKDPTDLYDSARGRTTQADESKPSGLGEGANKLPSQTLPVKNLKGGE